MEKCGSLWQAVPRRFWVSGFLNCDVFRTQEKFNTVRFSELLKGKKPWVPETHIKNTTLLYHCNRGCCDYLISISNTHLSNTWEFHHLQKLKKVRLIPFQCSATEWMWWNLRVFKRQKGMLVTKLYYICHAVQQQTNKKRFFSNIAWYRRKNMDGLGVQINHLLSL